LGACASAPRVTAPLPTPGTLAAVIDSITASAPLDRTHWGVEVYDPAARRMLYRLNPDQHFIPASNTKLVVTAVALGVLGADYRYRTELYAMGPEGGVTGSAEVGARVIPNARSDSYDYTESFSASLAKSAEGVPALRVVARAGTPDAAAVAGLLIVARGDPTLSRRFHPTGPTPLEMLADSVVAAGIREVRGEVVIDATYLEDHPVHPAWEVGDLTWQYAAPTAAFAVDEATLRVVVAPGAAPGAPAHVEPLAPRGAVTLQAAVTTDTMGSPRRVSIRRHYLSDIIEFTGTVPLDAGPDTVLLAAPYPAELAGREFVAALAARGVEVYGGVRIVHDSLEAATLRANPSGGGSPRLIATWNSAPLSEIVASILQPSQNWIAEQLLKTLGAQRGEGGSWREGLKVERRYLIDVVGIDSTAIWLSDGSGLSAQNLLTPHAIVQLLDYARRRPWGTVYLQAMAKPGESGTLERRLTDLEGRLFAKTGSVTHVNTLSGYLRSADGRELLFSILTNASGWPAADLRRAMDRMVRAMAERGSEP
jgi:D-alanyl-D-alanine carboxypeptidase/D-alanyl-D-alanine-endopeptidase (penicillin-binding protein 4)